MIDVDHFKRYNDRHGHPAGDDALRGVSKILQHGRRANDVVARYGGEEFAIILLDVGKAAAKEVAERICAQVAEFPFEFGSTQPLGQADDLARRRLVPRRRRRAGAGAVRGRPRAVRRQERRPQPRPRRRASRTARGERARRRARRRRLGRRARARWPRARGHDVALWEVDRGGGRTRWRAIAPAPRSVAGLSPARRGRGLERPRRRRSRAREMRGGRRPVGVRCAPRSRRAPRRPLAAGADRRLRLEGARARQRRDDGRGDRRRACPGARVVRAVGAELRAGDRGRAAGRAGGGLGRRRGRGRRRPGRLGGERLRHLHQRRRRPASASAARSRTSSPSPSAAATASASATTRAPRSITRGLAEMGRLAERMGGQPLTLAGPGRPRRSGAHLHRRAVAQPPGRPGARPRRGARRRSSPASATSPRASGTARTARDLAERLGVDMPITREVAAVLYDGKPPRAAVNDLLARDVGAER